jgi:hypothetical protein
MAVAQFIAGAEGFDIYGSGNIPANYPWFVTDATRQGQINPTAGAFGGSALTFPMSGLSASLASGFEYQFPSSLVMTRGNTTANGKGVFAINGWLNVSSMTTGSGTLLGLGTAGATGVAYPLLNISQSATAGTNLQFVTNINSPSSAPYNFNIQLNTYYWISMQFAFYSTSSATSSAVLLATYTINGTTIQQDIPVTWGGDVFTSVQFANRLKFYASNFITHFWDDVVVQAVSGADTNWPLAGGVNPTPEAVPTISARRIYAVSASANGSLSQWTPSGAQPNWQSATDPTGANYVTATDTALTDTYKWSAPAVSDVRAVVIRGNSNRFQNVNGSFKASGGALTQMPTNNGPSRYIGVCENDGTNAWTQTSINAAEFGQTSK